MSKLQYIKMRARGYFAENLCTMRECILAAMDDYAREVTK